MRVLHVYKDYPPVIGGIENHLKMLAEGQAAQGLDVTVLVTSRSHHTVIENVGGVRVVKAARVMKVASTPLSLTFFAWLRRMDADLVHLHFPYPPGDLGYFLLAHDRKLVITYHSDVVRQRLMLRLYGPLLWRSLTRADAIIATSPDYVQTSPFLRKVAGKCQIIAMGTEPSRFDRVVDTEVETVRQRYEGPLLLFVGRLRYYKGVDYLLHALLDIPARLVIVGTGPKQQECQALAARLGLTDRVFFPGDIPDERLPAYYHACDVFVLPSGHRSEAFGTVLLEAMAARRPVVSTDLGTGTSYVNRHGLTGLVVPPRSPGALAQAVKSLLADPECRRAMGDAGRQRVQAEFTKDLMVERTIELYKRVLHG